MSLPAYQMIESGIHTHAGWHADAGVPPPANATNEEQAGAAELCMWLSALRSVFDPQNHPFSGNDRAGLLVRDFAGETAAVEQALRRALLLTLTLGPGAAAAQEPALQTLAGRGGVAEDLSARELTEALTELCGLCASVLGVGRVSFASWTNLGRVVARTLAAVSLYDQLRRAARGRALQERHPELVSLVERLKPDALAADYFAIFSRLAQMLGRLRRIENLLARDQPLKHALLIFTLVHEEARELVRFIETRVTRGEGVDPAALELLDGTGYAIGMELHKVFERELVGLAALRQPPVIFTKVESAHGLLRDCFQQSLAALARHFEPDLCEARLFHSYRTKLEQSLVLRGDLWALLQFVRRVEQERDRWPLATVLERLVAFQAGSLRYLMYKDWESYERFVSEVAVARGGAELAPLLHRFATYLEALFTQISMRAVLADQPFDFPPPQA